MLSTTWATTLDHFCWMGKMNARHESALGFDERELQKRGG